MAIKTIAIDSGKFATKAVTRKPDGTERKVSFRTKMEPTMRSEAQGNSFIVTYEGKKYMIGEQAEVLSSKTTKAEEIHRICAYTAITQLAESGDDLFIAIGCPLTMYENADTRKAYKDYMFPTKEIHINVNGVTRHYNVKSVAVFPESAGVIYLDKEKYGQATVGVIDIGGLNVNASVYRQETPIVSTIFTDNLGSNVLTNGLLNQLQTYYSEDIPDWMAEEILRDGYMVDNMAVDGIRECSAKLVEDYKKDHLRKIIRQCEENGWNMRATKLIFTGGTSLLLAKEIRSMYPTAVISEDAAFANVRGFLKELAG